VTGFLGPNGAGKSTTMRMILGLDAPSSGSVLVNGKSYREHNDPLRSVGALLDANAIVGGRSAANHLAWLADSNGIDRRRVSEVLDVVGLGDVVGKRVGTFSLGMSQRLGIAAALLGDPDRRGPAGARGRRASSPARGRNRQLRARGALGLLLRRQRCTEGAFAMAELMTEATQTSSCCSAEAQATCCEPSEKEACCGQSAAAQTCGCSAGKSAQADIRETVRARYAEAARALTADEPASCNCSTLNNRDRTGSEVFGGALYDGQEVDGATVGSINASLGCGVPTAVADLKPGEVVLDLGSGAGADVLISARRVGPTGRAIGLDMTDEMLDLARANAKTAGVANFEFVKGYMEEMPLADDSVDVVISNCVINLAGDKPKVVAEAARVLGPGGRFAVSDVIADPELDDQTRADMAAWTGCIAGALTEPEFRATLEAAGFEEIEITETHRVHKHAGAAIIRALMPRRSR
jgi:arsenite methyltransferase